jgi:predicted PurR-regulated permease PerM
MPVIAALIVGLTLAPVVSGAERSGVPTWVSAPGIVVVLLIAAAVTATLIAAPMAEWIDRAPEIGALVKRKISLLALPLSALKDLQDIFMPTNAGVVAVPDTRLSVVTPVLAFVTPAVAEFVVFFVALLFILVGHTEVRHLPLALVNTRAAKLRVIRIIRDSQSNLTSYLAMVTIINAGLGVIVAGGTWALGMPNPVLFGVLAAVLNYIPYIGPACVVAILFGVGLVSFPGLGYALVPPACFVVLTTLEGQIITPAILGSRLPLRPLAIFLSLAFWAWLWGPIGAFLAVPLAIIARVIVKHLFQSKEPSLPE